MTSCQRVSICIRCKICEFSTTYESNRKHDGATERINSETPTRPERTVEHRLQLQRNDWRPHCQQAMKAQPGVQWEGVADLNNRELGAMQSTAAGGCCARRLGITAASRGLTFRIRRPSIRRRYGAATVVSHTMRRSAVGGQREK